MRKNAVRPTAAAPTSPPPPKRNERYPLEALAVALRKLPWADMARIAEHIADQYDHLLKADRLDRDGVAQVLAEMADDILKEAEVSRAATTTGCDQ